MAALFPRWATTAMRAALLAIGCGMIGIPVGLWAWARAPGATGQYAPVAQPIAFDHRLHAHDFHIDCRFCHALAERSSTAGLPPTKTCVGCHSPLYLNSPLLAPVRQSLATGKPIPWRRVTSVPGFVYFDHSVHLAKGIGCESCHGRVDRMQQVVQVAPLTMNWCLDCHRDPAAHLRPPEQVATMGWQPNEPQSVLGAKLAREHHVRRLTSCTTCHR